MLARSGLADDRHYPGFAFARRRERARVNVDTHTAQRLGHAVMRFGLIVGKYKSGACHDATVYAAQDLCQPS